MTGSILTGETKQRLTQRRAAHLLDVSQAHLNRVLRGKTKSNTLLARYNELAEQYNKGELKDCEFSDAQVRRIALAAYMLNVETADLADVLGAVTEEPELLQRFRTFARLTKRPEEFFALISVDWAQHAENQTTPQNDKNEQNEPQSREPGTEN